MDDWIISVEMLPVQIMSVQRGVNSSADAVSGSPGNLKLRNCSEEYQQPGDW